MEHPSLRKYKEQEVVNSKESYENGVSSDGEKDQDLQEAACDEKISKNFRLCSGHPKSDRKLALSKNFPISAENVGTWLPEAIKLNCAEEKKKISQMDLIFFNPFRTRDGPFGDNSSYLESLKTFKKMSAYSNIEAP